MLRVELDLNPRLLATYFNVMILARAFKLNQILLLHNAETYKSRTSTNDSNSSNNDTYNYDADTENDQQLHQRLDLNGFTTHSTRHDLIHFPKATRNQSGTHSRQ